MPPPHSNRAGAKPGTRPSDPKSNERNEYIPSFIAKKPFYIDDATASDSDYLEHQRLQSEKNNDPLATAQWYDRGLKKGPAATKYRKGACENCGSLSHKTKDCLQRKRKLGARWTGKDIAADEIVKDVKLGWDAKRDRWNGFEATEFQEVVDEYNALEELKKAASGEKQGGGLGDDEDDMNGNEDAKYDEETDMGRKQATSTRNLRLREDTAKYLVNLDLESAKYDPKTRSMVDTGDPQSTEAEDGFSRGSGDAAEFERAQKYAWEMQERGNKDKIHIQANPTEAQIIRKRKAEENMQRSETQKKALLDKYGSQDEVGKKRPGITGGEVVSSERYVEYDEHGKIKGQPEKKEKSMYAEDVLINNHTSVWGSWWKNFQWGYYCCHSTVKNSFCTGEAGKHASQESQKFSRVFLMPSAEDAGNAVEVERADAWREEERSQEHVPNSVDRPEKVNMDESRRRLDEMKAGVTEAEMEKYRRERVAKSDPMANMLGKDELLGA